MVMDKDSLTSLRDIIGSLLEDGTLPFNPRDACIWEEWDRVVGPSISNSAMPSWIKDGVLRVWVAEPIWLQELKFMEKDIRRKLNETLGREAVRKIEFRVGPK
jgi:predicted nucleic acid-binding Zn ribbon protein